MNEERIVLLARLLDDGIGGADRQLVARSDLELVARERRRGARRRRCAGRRAVDQRLRFAETLGIAEDVVAAERRVDRGRVVLELVQLIDAREVVA